MGETLGSYRVVAKLGEGGMGEVFLAEHPLMPRKAAVKLLLAELSKNEEAVNRFFNEARAAASIRHPGIVDVFDLGRTANGTAFIVMEFLEGESLAKRLQTRRKLAPATAIEIIRQAAAAVGTAHAKGIVHRDLKPDNIFLTPDPERPGTDRVKILDFGIAKLTGGGAEPGLVVTRSGATLGTPVYMAPEQWRDSAKVDKRADIYSLGCVLFECLCGRPPFTDTTFGDLVAAHIGRAPPRPRTLAGSTPAALEAVVLKALGKQPGERQQDMGEFARELTRAGAGLPAAPYVTEPDQGGPVLPPHARTTIGESIGERTPEPPWRSARPRPKWPFVLGGALLAAGVGVWAALRANGKRDDGGGGGAAASPSPSVSAALETPPQTEPSASAASAEPPTSPPAPPPEPEPKNRWILVAPPDQPVLLGSSAPDQVGFQPARQVFAPEVAFEIQQHEVTREELGQSGQGDLPAVVGWQAAVDHCQRIGGSLPTEAQWEYAARGPQRRLAPWGDVALDLKQVRAFAGAGGTLGQVMKSPLDQTPGAAAARIHDLAGNAREWTADAWHDDAPGPDEPWAAGFRAVRGLPLRQPRPKPLPVELAAYREPMCAVGCPASAAKARGDVGFRCVRPAR